MRFSWFFFLSMTTLMLAAPPVWATSYVPGLDSIEPCSLPHGDSECRVIASGAPFETGVYIYRSKRPGPRILVEAGIHGDEPAGTVALEHWLNRIEVLSGTLILLPRMNPPALEKGERFLHQDLNRSFPGDTAAAEWELKLASFLYATVKSLKPELVITLHESRLHTGIHETCCGHSLIHVREQPTSKFQAVLDRVNQQAQGRFDGFEARFADDPGASSETFTEHFGAHAYTVETWVRDPLPRRVMFQQRVVKAFLEEWGMRFRIGDAD